MVNAQVRAWLEIAYFSSGVVLAVLAAVGLWQIIIAKRLLDSTRRQVQLASDALSLAKNDLAIRSRREAVVLAAQQCAQFANEILPKNRDQRKIIGDAGIPFQRWSLENSSFDGSSIADIKGGQEWVNRVLKSPPARLALIAILNDLEAFAMYFARGAADEEIAYPVVGALFCEWVELYAPWIIGVRQQTARGVTSGQFQNVVDLYVCWSSRTKHQKLSVDAKRISSELNELGSIKIPPIGTEGV